MNNIKKIKMNLKMHKIMNFTIKHKIKTKIKLLQNK